MTPEQTAAYINAQTQICAIEVQAMLAANAERLSHGYSLAYGEEQWHDFKLSWEAVIGHNAVIEMYRSNQ